MSNTRWELPPPPVKVAYPFPWLPCPAAPWVPTLANQLNGWLTESFTTVSSQMTLWTVTITDGGKEDNVTSQCSMRSITHMTLNMFVFSIDRLTVSDTTDAPLDWVVLEVDDKTDDWLGSQEGCRFPYRLIAFPVAAITDYETEKRLVVHEAREPLDLRPRYGLDTPPLSPVAPPPEWVVDTVLNLEMKGRAPLVVGHREKDNEFCKIFLQACMDGRADIIINGDNALPFAPVDSDFDSD